MIKYITIIILGFAFIIGCGTTKKSTSTNDFTSHIYLVRHAEKSDDGTKNPPLTMEGKARAQNLAMLLKGKKITKIYSTDYKRTKETAVPISRETKIPISIYDPRDLDGFALELSSVKGANILVVGHSNSTPTLANKLLNSNSFKQFEETEYGTLLVITYVGTSTESEVLSF